jgi:hypothetical protein
MATSEDAKKRVDLTHGKALQREGRALVDNVIVGLSNGK